VKQLAPPSSDSKEKAVQSWDGVPRKNPDEPLKRFSKLRRKGKTNQA